MRTACHRSWSLQLTSSMCTAAGLRWKRLKTYWLLATISSQNRLSIWHHNKEVFRRRTGRHIALAIHRRKLIYCSNRSLGLEIDSVSEKFNLLIGLWQLRLMKSDLQRKHRPWRKTWSQTLHPVFRQQYRTSWTRTKTSPTNTMNKPVPLLGRLQKQTIIHLILINWLYPTYSKNRILTRNVTNGQH